MDFDKLLSPIVKAIPPSGIRKLFDIACEMDDVISLGIGEPDFVTPQSICEAGIRSLEQGYTHYTGNAGLGALRDEICTYVKRKYNLTYERAQTLVTVGGSEAIDAALRAVILPGDEVLIPEPSFVCYKPLTTLAGGTPVTIQTTAENDFRLTAAQLKSAITEKTKVLILPYPNNPTGAIMRREDLEEIASVLKNTEILVISDEIYSELNYTSEGHTSLAEIDGMYERTLLINGFSKTFAMTGWRMGYACGPKPWIKLMTKIHQFAIMCAPTTSQYAAIEALKNCDEDVLAMKKEYNQRRQLMRDGFLQMGLDCFEPLGAFYLFPCIKKTGLSSDEFCERLLREHKVAVVSGTAFGECGEGFIRCSYASSVRDLREALSRIAEFVECLRREK